eukprot:scaffold263445_cov15-Tisochrysis_lutea.AAC.1
MPQAKKAKSLATARALWPLVSPFSQSEAKYCLHGKQAASSAHKMISVDTSAELKADPLSMSLCCMRTSCASCTVPIRPFCHLHQVLQQT